MGKLIGLVNTAVLHGASISGCNCKVKRSYPKPCNADKLCDAVEGSFVTECASCERFN